MPTPLPNLNIPGGLLHRIVQAVIEWFLANQPQQPPTLLGTVTNVALIEDGDVVVRRALVLGNATPSDGGPLPDALSASQPYEGGVVMTAHSSGPGFTVTTEALATMFQGRAAKELVGDEVNPILSTVTSVEIGAAESVAIVPDPVGPPQS